MTVAYDEFADAHVLVTGAASGIGRAVAHAFAESGARVTAVDVNGDGLAATAEGHGAIACVTCDLADPEAIATMSAEVLAERGPVRVLVNNAGVDRRLSLDETDDATWRWMLSVNIDHHLHLARLLAPAMAAAGGGAIVNMSSSAWMKLAGNLAAYHAAKAGIVGLTRGLARDLGPKGIRVNAIAPGRVLTERARAKMTDAWVADTKALQCIPDLIEPADIAAAAIWLASSGARMITGQTLVVDGGVV